MPQVLRHFFERSSAKGARSSALHSLHVAIGLDFSGMMAAIWLDAPEWAVKLLAVILVVLFLVYVFAYLFLLFRDRDALRSESFTLSKLAMEKGLVGDDLTGLISAAESGQNLIESEVSGNKVGNS